MFYSIPYESMSSHHQLYKGFEEWAEICVPVVDNILINRLVQSLSLSLK